jgi:hypothetical protein
MSIGNLKTEGNKGNNFPWQLKMLLGQQCACDQLTEILTELQGTIDVNIVSGVTLEVNLDQNNDQVQVYGSDLTAPIATDTSGHLQVDVLTTPLPTNAATEITLAAINTKLTPALRTHNTVSAVGIGSIPAGSLSGSMLNAGNAAGIWNGASIPAGVSIPWAPIANRDTYGAIAYDATGTTFIIEYTT